MDSASIGEEARAPERSERTVESYLVELGKGRVEVAEVHERALAARHVGRAPDERAVRLPLLHLRAHCAASAVQRVLRRAARERSSNATPFLCVLCSVFTRCVESRSLCLQNTLERSTRRPLAHTSESTEFTVAKRGSCRCAIALRFTLSTHSASDEQMLPM